MSITEYYEKLGVTHGTNCEVCGGINTPIKHFKAASQHIRFWLVLDIILLVLALYIGAVLVKLIIYSITP